MLENAAVFASGNGSNFQAIINAVENKELKIKITLLICDNENAYAVERALAHGIDVILIDYKQYSAYEIENMLIKKLSERKVNYIFLAGFLRRLSPLFISQFPNNIINIHPSLLPKYKGLHAINQALANNDTKVGVSVHYVDEKLDNGPLILQDTIEVLNQTDEEVFKKVHELEHKLYVAAIKKIMEE